MERRKHMKKLFLIGVLGLAVAVFASSAAPVAAQSQAATNALESGVVKALLSLPHYSVFDNLFFERDGADVTLMGQVVLEISKAEASKRVAKVKGIGNVVNKIEVLPPSPSDDALRMSLYRKIFGESDLHRYSMGADPSIHIIVKGGHVTLVGMVDTEADRQRAEMVAKGLPGIFSFTNSIRLPR
jgi:hyperosmotically inducible periplasmic protein